MLEVVEFSCTHWGDRWVFDFARRRIVAVLEAIDVGAERFEFGAFLIEGLLRSLVD